MSLSQRIRMRTNQSEGLQKLDEIVLQHGWVNGAPFDFKDHEFQIEIIRDASSSLAVRKCSQVGLSELMVQKTLAFSVALPNKRAIFSLPTAQLSTKFSKDRFDSAIDASPTYSGMTKPGNNSASQKKIGSFVLYVTGSFGSNTAISVPCDVVINDEVDFSDQVVLGKMSSRLRASSIVDERGNRGLRARFSTPTVGGYGIDEMFEAGHQAYYMVRCKHCGQWVLPDFFHDVVVPGYDKAISELRRDDITNPSYKIDDTQILCPNGNCRKDLWSSLMDPERRQWVAKKPDVWEHSYQVYPWDAPVYNPPAVMLRQMKEYPLISDFYNFVVGIPYSDSENTFNTEQAYMRRLMSVAMWEYPTNVTRSIGVVMGMDVGKTCHLSIGVTVGKVVQVVRVEKLQNSRAEPAAGQVLARIDHYNCIKFCVDAGPDISLVNELISSRHCVTGVVYVRSVKGLQYFEEKEEGAIVNVDRTKSLKELLACHNNNEIEYPAVDSVTSEIFQHLDSTKKIREIASDGQTVERFVKSSNADHWVHSLNYLKIAQMLSREGAMTATVASYPRVGKVRVGSTSATSGAK